MSDKRKGRPTESKKDVLLQVRIDTQTLNDLDYCAKKENTNRSTIVRKGIKRIYDDIKK
ncbi:MAG: CopG family transcriptional regulator [Christensenellales bacterium]